MTGLKTKIRRHLSRHDFNPGLLGLLINPFYFARVGLRKHVSLLTRHLSGKMIDIGCGTKPYEELFKVSEYVGLEFDSPENRKSEKIDRFYDGKIFPFADKSFDSAFSSQVLEHVFNPEEHLKEVNRILKDGAYYLITVPFVWDEHLQPYDYARYSSFGLTHLLQKSGFEVIEYQKTVKNVAVIFQLWNAYIYKVIVKNGKRSEFWLAAFFCSFGNVLGLALSKILPENDDLFLDSVVLTRKTKN